MLGLGVTVLVDLESCSVLNPVVQSALPLSDVAAVAVRKCSACTLAGASSGSFHPARVDTRVLICVTRQCPALAALFLLECSGFSEFADISCLIRPLVCDFRILYKHV